jgi:NAD+ synthase (glutamine-hydrolysing)
MKVGLAQIDCWVGDLEGNVGRCVAAVERAAARGAEFVVLPELAVTGYPPRDLLLDPSFVTAALEATADLAERVQGGPPVVAGTLARGGLPPPRHPGLHNVAAVLEGGRVRVQVAKRLLPAYDVFYEPRWFVPGEAQAPVELADRRVGLLVCEDLWDEGYPVHPPAELRAAGADLLVCLAALPFRRGAAEARLRHARRARLPVVHVSAVGAQDELVFDGRSFVLDREGGVVAELPAFCEAVEVVDLSVIPSGVPAVAGGREQGQSSRARPRACDEGSAGAVLGSPRTVTADSSPERPRRRARNDSEDLNDLHDALVLGIRGFAEKNRLGRAFLGLSGGIDSALVARLGVDALGSDRVGAVAIPSRHTDPASTEAAREIASALGIGLDVVPLETLHGAAEKTLGAVIDESDDGRLADENLQARLRMVVLMAHVNRHRGFLLNTSNKTEISLGYGTLYGDLAGALAPIADLTKLDVFALARHLGGFPAFVLERPPTAELSPGQVDPFDYAVEAPRLESLVQSHCSDAALRRSEHKRTQFGVVLKVSETAFGSGRLVPITRR